MVGSFYNGNVCLGILFGQGLDHLQRKGGIDNRVLAANHRPYRQTAQLGDIFCAGLYAAAQRRNRTKAVRIPKRQLPHAGAAHAVPGEAHPFRVGLAAFLHRADQLHQCLLHIFPAPAGSRQLWDQDIGLRGKLSVLQILRQAVSLGDQFQVVPLAAAAVQVKNKRHIFHRSRRRIKPVADHAAVAQRKMLLCKGGLLNLLLVLLLLRNSGLRLLCQTLVAGNRWFNLCFGHCCFARFVRVAPLRGLFLFAGSFFCIFFHSRRNQRRFFSCAFLIRAAAAHGKQKSNR